MNVRFIECRNIKSQLITSVQDILKIPCSLYKSEGQQTPLCNKIFIILSIYMGDGFIAILASDPLIRGTLIKLIIDIK